ncbi:ATP-binding protein [Streptomyces sp. NPDC032940]|uniref:ATP-binding protein n=1 Tax=Streptomyces sp. NPDC032940 TaxID=3155366 RepID=UPI0033E870FD
MLRTGFTLQATPATVRAARKRIVATVRSWRVRLDEEREVCLALVASELLTNGLVHAGGRLTVSLVLDGDILVVEVSDTDGTLPRRRPADHAAEGGRGLTVLDGLCVLRGAEPTETGKRCYAVLDLNAPAPHQEPAPAHALGEEPGPVRWTLTPAGSRLLTALP